MNCEICHFQMSEPVPELFVLPTVTSDCRPWNAGRSVSICSRCGVMKRVIDTNFNTDYYHDYKNYPEPTGRTKKILEFVKNKMPEPKEILDIGAGNGAGMETIRKIYPDARVFGYEPTISTERPTSKFNLVTLFHVLEHVEDLHEMLAYIKSILTENGHVLIQVPCTQAWPFDLIIADHIWNFSPKSLVKLLFNNGFRLRIVGNKPIQKEFTILASMGDPVFPDVIQEEEQKPIDWLLNFKSKLDNVQGKSIVYGSSVSACWAGSILGNRVIAYIDDDETRVGKKFFDGREIKSISYGEGNRIVAPFPDWQLSELKEKHPQLSFV